MSYLAIRHGRLKIRVNRLSASALRRPCVNSLNSITHAHPVDEDFVAFLHLQHLLDVRHQRCGCGRLMSLEKRKKRGDGFILYCNACKQERSIRHGSFFEEHPKVPLPALIQIIRELEQQHKQEDIAQCVGVSCNTISSIHSSLLPRLHAYHIRHPIRFTATQTVEIDETKMDWESTTGRRRETGEWILGMVARQQQRGPLIVSLIPVTDRSQADLVPFIITSIDSNATVMTDAWTSYNNLSVTGLRHYVINKQQDGFARTQRVGRRLLNINVNHIESVWHQLRMIIAHRHGVRRRNVPAALEEFMFIRGGNHFFDMIKM
jgi:ISXO2-like transposase domain